VLQTDIDAVQTLNLEMAHRMSAEKQRAPKLITCPLLIGERSALAAALKNSKLPIEDIEAPGRLFWRFETVDNVSVGFGGLELYAGDALLRSIVALPPVRGKGFGSAIVAALEAEAELRSCRSLWLISTSAAEFFDRLGYVKCDRAAVPSAISTTTEFAALCPANADVLVKHLA
jgi:N-acetylglutamate synthase-like GNAT family acetyltransferase